MDKQISVSIIIPAYNVECYIEEALDSIQRQTRLPDEVIIIDDGSTDGTLERLKNYEFKIAHKIISKKNQGQGIARNIGIEKASGDYIYFFDADDILTPNFIESLHKILSEHNFPSIFLFSGKSFYDGGAQATDFEVSYLRGFEGYFPNSESFFPNIMEKPNWSCSPCLYVSQRSLWTEKHLRFKANYHEDEEIFYPLLFACRDYVVSDTIYFLRRIRPNSTMTSRRSNKHIVGIKQTADTLVELKKSHKDKLSRFLINRRIAQFTVSYVNASIKADEKISYRYLFKQVIEIKSPKLVVQLLARICMPSRFGLRVEK